MKLKLTRKKPENGDGDAAKPPPQGIAAHGNALRQLALVALGIVLVPVLLGFAYLKLVREPGLESDQIDRVASAYAMQQATNIDRLFMRLGERLSGAAGTPSAWSAIESASAEQLNALEQSLLSFFPEAIGLRVLPVGELGTATFTSADQGLRSHIQVDMVRRSSEGKQVAPESYEVEGQWYTSFVSLVKHPQIDDRRAVILLTLDNDYLSSQLSALNTDLGAFALEQLHISKTGREQARTIATSGSSNSDDVWYAELPNADWRVAFSPSRALEDELGINGLPLLAVLAMTLLAAIGSVGLFVRRFPRTLEREAEKIIAAADRRSPLELKVPELIEVAKQLRRVTLRTLRQAEGEPKAAASDAAPAATPAQDEVLANPLYHAQGGMLVEEHDADSLDLDLALNEEAAPAGGKLPDHIFRAYDIRGHAKQELTDDLVTRIGKAIGTIAGERGEQTLIIGCDGRTSSPRIKAALVRALMETGRDIVDIGLVPTPLLYYATRHLEYHSGIMVTGSHNPPDDNGLKIVLDQQTIAAGGIQEIKQRAAAGNFADGNGRMVREDIVADYIHEILEDIAIAVPLKVVIDAGNGATGEVAPELFRELGCEVVPLHCKIDGTFPNHPPDTSNENNLADLARAVKESSADFGVAFDGDGDRLAVVTSSGRIVRTDVLLMLYAQDVVSRNPGADVVFDVKCSRNLTNLITHHGGRPVLWKTGHAFMKEKMRETGALLGGEFSGHIFFGERWYGFDDGMYAAARLAEIMSTQSDSLDDAIDKFPTTVNTPEIIIPVPDDYKFQLIDKIVNNADFSSGKVNTLDGIRVDFSDGWGLVRASNTGPALTARFEADTPEHLEIIQDEFRAQIALIDPKVELNF